MIRIVWVSLLLTCLTALPARAHPHVFIDAGLTLVMDEDGRVAALRVAWAYDAFYSLMLIEDNGLDADHDGVPEPGELERLAGRDVDWEAPDFGGDLEVLVDGEPVALGGPMRHTAAWSDGRYVTTHLRPVETRIDPAAHSISARIYDPGYFAFYEITLPLRVEGRADCRLLRIPADLDAAEDALREKIAQLPANVDAEAEYPRVGAIFADSLRLECTAPS
ncbi:DUF1007 domain-containing protein [Maritimibacter sp. 55A14]|uniref:DUF1007 family protein n=1 Tax=Maritimibacter sp. 55A14 TaxID=2174844 RepID=UPI000D607542|nr:DUF1007 family protein [Maritimibacter sp. 55A14]PWE30479.1 DUF1007 domain-containing protein [Maritimibacter sp. 55A14]